ncbi:zinc ribbon domain-containing protein [Alkalihalophilus sp. As8PL]|uniref:Zinc ribbon domain-containing protein n=1 Tax=Alkalihalophilus sp. As8PL TaxID=3237103 RepID=A0AB39BPM6_9BACI
MNCTQCGNPLQPGSKFCTSCGSPVNIEVAATTQATATAQQPATNLQDNEYVKQGKQIGQQFLGFALTALKGPMNASRQVTSQDKVNGIITLLLFAFLMPLFSYTAIKGIGGGFVRPSFGDTVMQPFFILAIFLTTLVAVMFAVTKMMKVNLTFFDILARYATFMIVPVALLALSVLFSAISVYVFGFLLFILAMFAFFVASISTLHSVKEKHEAGLDVYYGIITTNIVMFIILLIIGDSIVGSLIDQISNELWFMF